VRGNGDGACSPRASRHFLAARELLSTHSLISSEEVHTVLPRFTHSLILGAVLLAACGGPDTGNPVAACNSFASAVCNKAQSCGATGVTGSCASQLQNSLDCAHVTCPAGTKFDSGAASECIDALNKLSCSDAANQLANNTLPGACNSICR
jgi:hypothetical protein